MANEITVTASLTFAKSLVADALEAIKKTFTMTGTDYVHATFQVPTTAGGTAIPKGDVTTPGWCCIINRDPTNFVTIKPAAAGTDAIKIKAGEFALFRSAGAAPAALADTAIVQIEYLMIED